MRTSVKNTFTLFIILFLFIVSTAYAQKLVILGWDGAGGDNVDCLLAQGLLPNLQALLDNGGVMLRVEPLTSTYTIPNWTVMWTGLTPDVTGAAGNKPWTPDWPMNLNKSLNKWTAQVPYCMTILRSLQKRGVKIGWFVSKEYLGGTEEQTPLTKITLHADDSLLRIPANIFDLDYSRDLADAALAFIKENSAGDFLAFLHLNPDYFGHHYGENSEEYLAEFVRCDAALGRIMRAVGVSGCRIIVVSDHGFNEGTTGHPNAPDNFLATNLPIDPKWIGGGATMRDFANTILAYFSLLKSHPKMHGKSLLR